MLADGPGIEEEVVVEPTTDEARGDTIRGGKAGLWAGTPPEVLARHTGFLLSKAGQLSHEEFDRLVGSMMGLKARHYGALAVLADEGPHAQSDLGDKLRIDRSTMVAVVDDLEGMGFVERRRDREDRRRYELTLTDAGRRAFSEAEGLVEGVQEAVLAPLDEAQRRQLHELLTSVLRGL